MAESLSVKPFRALTWSDAASADWALVQQCAAGDEDACTRLVTDHQRMVYQLGLQLLGDPQEALRTVKSITDLLVVHTPGYRCQRCGFSARAHHWQCPSCKNWGTIKPLLTSAS